MLRHIVLKALVFVLLAPLLAGAASKINIDSQTKGSLPLGRMSSIPGNSIVVNTTGSSTAPSTIVIGTSQLVGRGSSGNIAAITLGANLSMVGTTLNAAGGGGSSGFPAGAVGDIQTKVDASTFGSFTAVPACVTFLTVPTSANLRACLSDETGTGASYFVGGALGTPSSGTATNLTGLPLAGIVNATAASRLMGRQSGSAGAWQEITLGTNLSMSGTTLNATGGGGGSGDVVGPSSAVDSNVVLFDGLTGKLIKDSGSGLVNAGTLTDTRVCVYTASGTQIVCDTPKTGSGTNIVYATAPTIDAPVLSTKVNLPRVTAFPGSPSAGDTVIVTDDSAAGACDSAAGSSTTLCQWSGSAWVKLGDGGGAGGGDFSSNTSSSVDGEAVVFSGTAGKTGKRYTGTGIVKATSGVLANATAGTDYTTPTGTETLTNKRVNPRTGTTASSATPAINTDSVDLYSITALAANITSMTSSLTGTPVEGQKLLVWIKDNGTARTISWGASFQASSDLALPTTTTLGKYLYTSFMYNATAAKWFLIGKLDNF